MLGSDRSCRGLTLVARKIQSAGVGQKLQGTDVSC